MQDDNRRPVLTVSSFEKVSKVPKNSAHTWWSDRSSGQRARCALMGRPPKKLWYTPTEVTAMRRSSRSRHSIGLVDDPVDELNPYTRENQPLAMPPIQTRSHSVVSGTVRDTPRTFRTERSQSVAGGLRCTNYPSLGGSPVP